MAGSSDKERENIMQFQQLQQQLQMLLMQKQNIQLQASEIENALIEVEKSGKDKIYEIIGNVMLKKSKEELVKSLREKKELLELRSSTIEKQVDKLSEKASELREGFSKEKKD
jgi:prefoldin beta subunit